MSRRIVQKRKLNILEVPESSQRNDIIKKLRPLIDELMKLTRTERQIEIDNKLMRSAGSLITSAKENKLYIDISHFNISPLWSQARVLSDRKCEGTIDYTEEGSKEHTIEMKILFEMTESKITAKVTAHCKVPFHTSMSPNTQAILLLNDRLSEEYSTSVEVLSSGKCQILKLHLGTEKIEIERIAGFVDLSFLIERSLDDDISTIIKNIKEMGTKIAEANIFKKGVIIVKNIDKDGRIIGEPEEITEQQLIDSAFEEDI